MKVAESFCGIICSKCDYKNKVNCPGCFACKGKPFHGECRVAVCCISKNLRHCGECAEFPCELLKEFAYDKEHGDDGERIRNLEGLIHIKE